MRTTGPFGLLLVAATVLLATACSSNPAVEPVLTVGGWSWDPAVAGDRPLPVLWGSDGTPRRLPLPPPGDCPSSGAVMTLVAKGTAPVAGGIAVRCDGGASTFVPVAWPDATTVQLLQLAPRTTQGTVTAMAAFEGRVYAAGAVGFLHPQPAVWVDGVLKTAEPLAFIPPGHDAALLTAIVPTANYVVATGIAHANAEHNDGADIDALKVTSIYVEQGTVLKRFTARAKGRGNRISKPTCHIYVTVGN